MLGNAKYRAKRDNLPFNITHEDIIIPDVCPVFKIPLRKHKGSQGDGSPTLDRVVGDLGYVKGNVRVISNKANKLKSNASGWELQRLYEDTAEFIENKLMKQ